MFLWLLSCVALWFVGPWPSYLVLIQCPHEACLLMVGEEVWSLGLVAKMDQSSYLGG